MKKPLVAVAWLDAHGSATAELEEHELPSEPVEFTTYGLLVKDCPAGVVVAAEETKTGTYRGWTFIPRGMIQHIKHLERHRGGSHVRKVRGAGGNSPERHSGGEGIQPEGTGRAE